MKDPVTGGGVILPGDQYEQADPFVGGLINAIVATWEHYGSPKDPLSESGRKVVELIIKTWFDTYPEEAAAWVENRNIYRDNELTAGQQVRQDTGASLASYPQYIYEILTKVFPDFKFGERNSCLAFIKRFPMFRFSKVR